MVRVILVRYSEIALKGKNRPVFEKKLQNNIRDCLSSNGIDAQVIRKRGRIVIETEKECLALARVFGISSFSQATRIPFDMDTLKDVIDNVIGNEKTFRITANRGDNTVSTKSTDINIILGQHVVDKFSLQVDLEKAELDIGIDMFDKDAYVFTTKTAGPGGLPYGVNSKANALIESEKSIAAAWLLMRRGVKVFPIAFTDMDIGLLKNYSYGSKMELGIIKELPQEGVLIVDQLFKEMKKMDTTAVVLTPLIGFTDEKVDELLKFIKL